MECMRDATAGATNLVAGPGRRRRRARRLAAVLGVAVASVLLAGCQVELSTGHADVAMKYASGALKIGVQDDTGSSPAWREASATRLVVKAQARTTVPSGSRWAFLGPPGSDVWILPQAQTPNLLWLGWNTQEIPAGVFQNERVEWRMLSVSGPGAVHLYTTNSFGTPTVRFDSDDGLPDTQPVNRGTHAHGNWAFTKAGTYSVVLEVRGTLTGGATSAARATFTFDVRST